MKQFILSIDQGTTSSRVVIYDKSFSVIDSLQTQLNQFFPKDGWIEQSAIEIWDDVQQLIKKILKKNNIKTSQIISIGISNQRETTVLWDKNTGIPVHNAIVWQDRRTVEICNNLHERKLDKAIQEITGLVVDPYFSATKIKWILDNNSDARRLVKEKNLLFGTIDTWLLWNLTEKASHLTDITNASRTMLFDLKKEEWSLDLLKILDIPKEILPKVVENTFNFGNTKLFGSSVPICGMAGDQQSSAIGQACFEKSEVKSTYGTGCFLLMNIGEKFQLSKNKLLTSVAYKINNKKMYCFEGSIFVAGSAIQWLRDKLFFFEDSKETELLYSKANSDAGILIVPALTGLGAPYWQPNARGTIFGLTRDTSIADIVKATLDSLCYQTFDLIESMEKDSNLKISEIKIDGGMADNKEFAQNLSNILQLKIIKSGNVEASALGAAYLAYLGSGAIKEIGSLINLKNKEVSENNIINYYPKIKKTLVEKKITSWKKAISSVINFYK
ncbi:MAG: glycerol kinase [Chloroflexi bacterium]|nr:glycerol kinase [Chloroflexota bacterium]